MTTMFGADADELERIGLALTQAADQFDAEGAALGRLLGNVHWIGEVASSFENDWNGRQMPQLGLATNFLREAAETLYRNAQEQRSTSAVGSGDAGMWSGGATTPGESLHLIADALELLGLPPAMLVEVAELLKTLDPKLVGTVASLLSNEAFLGALTVADKAVNVGSAVVAFVADFVDNPQYELHERVVHAVVDSFTQFALGEGLEIIGAALGGMVPIPGGPIVGRLIGIGVSAALELTGATGAVGEVAADAAIETMRAVGDVAGVVVDVVDAGVTVVGGAADLVVDVVGTGVDVVGGGVELLGDGADEVLGWFGLLATKQVSQQ